jgi:cation:H+ antiporter
MFDAIGGSAMSPAAMSSGVLIAIGFVILLYSGDCLVRGALAAAHKTNMSPLLVGIVIVGFGTSLPEMFIAVQSALDGRTGLAHGNIVGSNIANIWLVMALPALGFPIVTNAPRMRLTAGFMLLVTIAWIVVTMFYGLNPLIGAIFLGVLAVWLIASVSFSRTDHSEDTPADEKLKRTPFWRMMMLMLIGLVGLPLGSRLLIDGGASLAQNADISEELVGLTLLAVGSSLPELGAGLAAAWRKQNEVAMGNILGSNIFNMLGAGGAVALIGQQQLSPEFHGYSHWAMIAAAVMITLVVFLRRRVGVATGVVFLGLYMLYVYGLVQNWDFGDMKYILLERPDAALPN